MSNTNSDRHEKFKFLQTSPAPMIFLLHNPNTRPIDSDDKIHMIHNCFDADVFIKECISFFGEDRRAVLCIDLTTSKQKVIRGLLKDIEEYLLNNKVLGNLCLVVDGITNQKITI